MAITYSEGKEVRDDAAPTDADARVDESVEDAAPAPKTPAATPAGKRINAAPKKMPTTTGRKPKR